MKKYLFPALFSISIILVGTLISSILYYFNITSDKINSVLLYLIGIIAIFTGSLKLAKNLKYKGIITGAVYFLAWFIIMVFLSLVIFKSSFTTNGIIFYLILLVFSILGGIIGKNTQEENDVN